MAKRAAKKSPRAVRERKIIVHIAVSADGFIARPEGSVDWLDRPQPKGLYGIGEFYKSIDTILFGRKTYETALSFQKEGVPGSSFDKRLKNYVFTRTLKAADAVDGVEFVDEPIKAFASRIRAEKGKNIWNDGRWRHHRFVSLTRANSTSSSSL